jgi:uncharacterized protein YneF (UPF0154 family)
MLVVIAIVIVGLVGGKLLVRRFPTVSRKQVFCAIAAWIASVSLAGMRARYPYWYYPSLVIGVVMGTFLVLALFRHWDNQRPPPGSR